LKNNSLLKPLKIEWLLFFIPPQAQLCCVQKKGQKTTQRSCEKRGKKIKQNTP